MYSKRSRNRITLSSSTKESVRSNVYGVVKYTLFSFTFTDLITVCDMEEVVGSRPNYHCITCLRCMGCYITRSFHRFERYLSLFMLLMKASHNNSTTTPTITLWPSRTSIAYFRTFGDHDSLHATNPFLQRASGALPSIHYSHVHSPASSSLDPGLSLAYPRQDS